MLHRFHDPAVVTALCATLAAAAPAAAQDTAQDAPPLDTVMATVGETEITLGHMIAASTTLHEQYRQLPAGQLVQGIGQQLISQEVLRQAHEGDLPPPARYLLENEERAIAADAVMDTITAKAVTETELRAAYDEKYGETGDTTEYRAAHILVETEDEAQKLAQEIADGANFAALAQAHSTGPSGPSGGDLGWFGEGVMVPAFEEAVAAMEPDEVSAPVQTQFGWHLIKLHETRAKEKPAFEEVRAELVQQLSRAAIEARVEALRAQTDIDASGIDGMDPALIKRFDLLEN